MIRKIPTLAAFALVVFACSRSGKMQRDQKQYDVVPEGSASGVTSTINGPGETTAPVTDTNADTTTNFTIPANPSPLGNDTAGTTAPVAQQPLRPRVYTPPPRPQELRPEPATDTTMTTTDSETTTTTTTTSPSTKKKSEKDQPPPPPPTGTTGTRG